MDGEVGLVGIHAFHNDGLARQRTPRQTYLDIDGLKWTSDGPFDGPRPNWFRNECCETLATTCGATQNRTVDLILIRDAL